MPIFNNPNNNNQNRWPFLGSQDPWNQQNYGNQQNPAHQGYQGYAPINQQCPNYNCNGNNYTRVHTYPEQGYTPHQQTDGLGINIPWSPPPKPEKLIKLESEYTATVNRQSQESCNHNSILCELQDLKYQIHQARTEYGLSIAKDMMYSILESPKRNKNITADIKHSIFIAISENLFCLKSEVINSIITEAERQWHDEGLEHWSTSLHRYFKTSIYTIIFVGLLGLVFGLFHFVNCYSQDKRLESNTTGPIGEADSNQSDLDSSVDSHLALVTKDTSGIYTEEESPVNNITGQVTEEKTTVPDQIPDNSHTNSQESSVAIDNNSVYNVKKVPITATDNPNNPFPPNTNSSDANDKPSLPQSVPIHTDGSNPKRTYDFDKVRTSFPNLATYNNDGLKNLKLLGMKPNVTDENVKSVDSLPKLETVYFCHCENVTKTGLSYLLKHTTISSIIISHCNNISSKDVDDLIKQWNAQPTDRTCKIVYINSNNIKRTVYRSPSLHPIPLD